MESSTVEVTQTKAGKKHSINDYYSIIRNDQKIWMNLDFSEIGTTDSIAKKTFNVKEWYYHFNGKKYYKLYDDKETFKGFVEEISIRKANNIGGIGQATTQYITVIQSNGTIWDDFQFINGKTTKEMYQRTYRATEYFNHFNGSKYLSVYDNKGNWRGYLNERDGNASSTPGGKWNSTNQYVTITKNSGTIWNDFGFKSGRSTKEMYQRTYRATGYYNHFNGSKYLSVYDNKGNWQGYLNERDGSASSTPGGKWNSTNQYVTITKNSGTIWNDFGFKSGRSTKEMYQRTYRATGYYNHFNGSKYLSVYDNKGNWQGYLNERDGNASSTPGGKWNSTNQYVTITKNSGTIWNDFGFKSGRSTKEMYQRTYRATGYYNHFNGSKYLSVYDNKGNWQGYLNERDGNASSTPGGKWNSTNQYVTITKNSGTIWNDFGFKSGRSTKEMYQRTYRATGYYNHFNGSKYLSVYDNKGNWQGYLNERDGAKASGAQGTGFSMNKSVLVVKSGYSIWNNFSWKEKQRTNSLINKTYQIKWYYKHMNGSTYYSLYESNGKWLGYVNSGAVRERRGAAHYLGTSRQRIINELTAHQNDRFYFGTPYRGLNSSNPEPYMVPYGAPNQYGPGMNCTGFVACVMRRSGGNLQRISGITQGWGSYANAYNWRDALMRNTEYYTFNSVDALLKSGKAQKGDIIYFDPVWSDINYDCHIGIFWGNSSKENRIWHQVLAGNMQSHIFSGTRFSKIFLFPQD
ncbi:MAG: NLPC-P60 domain-containing protein [Enterococcus gilvus]|uniref:hypothetical protein n=1 Tax=Enterococcus gilvus TaxID=160453 RepID=UPI0039F5383D